MVRRKRSSSVLKKVIAETKESDIVKDLSKRLSPFRASVVGPSQPTKPKTGPEVVKDLFKRRSSVRVSSESSSREKNHKAEDSDAVLSHVEDSFQSVVNDVLESIAEISEEEKEEEEDENTRTKQNTRKSQVGKKIKKRGVNVLQEIKHYQKSTELIIPRAPFARACRDIFLGYGGPELRISKTAFECLQESAEMFMCHFFEDAYLCSLHCNRKTLMTKDLRLARRLGSRYSNYV